MAGRSVQLQERVEGGGGEAEEDGEEDEEGDTGYFDISAEDVEVQMDEPEDEDSEDTFEREEIHFQVRVNSDNELDSGAEEEPGEDYLRLSLPRLSAVKQPRVKDEFEDELGTAREVAASSPGEQAAGGKARRRRKSVPVRKVPEGEQDACPLCAQTGGAFTGSQGEMALHFIQAHTDTDQGLECTECGYKTSQRSHLTDHINAAHRQMKYCCDLCDFQTKWKNRIKSHKVSVHKVGGLPCPSCDYTASESWVLSQHVKVVHRLVGQDYGNFHICCYRLKTGDTDNLDPRYQCGYCDYRASQKSHLKTHVDAIHQQVCFECLATNNSLVSFQLMFCCDMCPYQTKWKSRLKSHTKAKHMGTFISCDHCEFKTIEKHALKKHIAKKHGDIKFACFTCNDNFLTRIDLKKHMGDVHHMESCDFIATQKS
jgi:hypothetical protein